MREGGKITAGAACGDVLTLAEACSRYGWLREWKRGEWQALGPKPRVFGGMDRAEQRRKGSMRVGGKIAAGAACGDVLMLAEACSRLGRLWKWKKRGGKRG